MPGSNCTCGAEQYRGVEQTRANAPAVRRAETDWAVLADLAGNLAEAAGRLSVTTPGVLQTIVSNRRALRERFQAGFQAELAAQLFKFERDLMARKVAIPMSVGQAGGAHRVLTTVSARDFAFDVPESPIGLELVHERLRRQAMSLGANAIINLSYEFGPVNRLNRQEAEGLAARLTAFIREVSDVPPPAVKEIIGPPTRRASAIGTAVVLLPTLINGVAYEVCSPARPFAALT